MKSKREDDDEGVEWEEEQPAGKFMIVITVN